MNHSRLKLTSKCLFVWTQLWFVGLTVRMGVPVVEFILGERPHWIRWIYCIPRAWPVRENARWFQYWPLLLPLGVVIVASAIQGIAELKKQRAERSYLRENCN